MISVKRISSFFLMLIKLAINSLYELDIKKNIDNVCSCSKWKWFENVYEN